MLVLIKKLIFAFWHRTTNNQWCTRIVNQHRVHLIHDGIIVSALYKIHRASSHIIAEVIETKLIVGTKRDIASIRTTTLIGVRTMFVDTVHCQSMEHIKRTHPLRVTLSEIIIDSHHMHAFVGHSIEEYWQGSHQGLTLTRSHLGDRTTLLFIVLDGTVEYHTTNELHIIMHHIPYDFIATRSPSIVVDSFIAINLHKVEACIRSQVAIHLGSCHGDGLVFSETTSCTLDNSKSIWQDVIECLVIDIQHLFL